MTRARRRLIAGAALWAVSALVVTAVPASPAAARPPGRTVAQHLPDPDGFASEPVADLTVARLSGIVTPSGSLALRARVDNRTAAPLDDLQILVSVHGRTTSRFAYQQAVDAGEVGQLWASTQVDAGPVPAHGSRRVNIVRSAAQLGLDNDGLAGVYPLRVELVGDGEVLSSVTTSLVLLPEQVPEPLRFTFLTAVNRPPSLTGDRAGRDLARAVLDGTRMRHMVGALAQRPDVPITMATSGLLLEQAAALADGRRPAPIVGADPPPDASVIAGATAFLSDVRTAAERSTTTQLALAYGPGDLVALHRHGLEPEAIRHISEGLSTVERLSRSRPRPDVLWAPRGVDQATVDDVLRPSGIDTLVLSERYLAIPEDRELLETPSPVGRLRTATGSDFRLLVPDPWLSEAVGATDGDASPAVWVQRVVAESAAAYFERPNTDRTRGLLMATPLLWRPPRGAVPALLDSLAQAPWLELVSLQELARNVEPREGIQRLAYPDPAVRAELPGEYLAELEAARNALGSLSTVLADEDDPIGVYDQLLLASASVHYRPLRRRDEGRELIATVSDAVSDLYGSIHVEDAVPITLTSINGQVPVTLRNDSAERLRVVVSLETNRYEVVNGGLAGKEVLLEPDSVVTVAFDVRALTPGGTAPIPVVVTDPEGMIALATGRIVVHSTAYSTVALVITAGAGLFLVLWWVRDAVRRRASARPAEQERAAA